MPDDYEVKAHVGDVGLIIEATIVDEFNEVVPISDATTKQLLLRSPRNVNNWRTAAFTTDGTDGKIRYATVADDLSMGGKWRLQARVITPSRDFHTSRHILEVEDNITGDVQPAGTGGGMGVTAPQVVVQIT